MSVDEDMLYESLHESWNEIEELKAENTRLRELNRHLTKGNLLHWLTDADAYEQHKREREMQASTAELQAENAKLRELVADMYKAFMHGNCYRWCEFKEPCNYISDGRCQWYDRMHELGVEV